VMILKKPPASLKGELTRWLIELQPGVFVGNPTQRVREELWKKTTRRKRSGHVLQLWSTPSPQGFAFREHGDSKRQLTDFDGLALVTLIDKVPF